MLLPPEAFELCAQFRVPPDVPNSGLKLGIATHTLHLLPLNGLRHAGTDTTCGWYIWGGPQLGAAPDFFQPLHAEHLASHCPQALRFLALPAGWRFLVAPGHADVWFDDSLVSRMPRSGSPD